MEELHNRQQAYFAHEFERCIINLADEVYGLSEPGKAPKERERYFIRLDKGEVCEVSRDVYDAF